MGVRSLRSGDVSALSLVLGRAFDSDPIFAAILPDGAQRRRALPVLFGEWMRLLHVADGFSYVADDLAGAALWSPPGKWHLGLLDLARMAPRMLAVLGSRTPAALRVLGAIDTAHPRRPHHYLRVIGCDPGQQGRGTGSALMEPALARCDAQGQPAYLESSNERNLPFYRRHGFEVTGEVVTPLGPRAWMMWREAR